MGFWTLKVPYHEDKFFGVDLGTMGLVLAARGDDTHSELTHEPRKIDISKHKTDPTSP